jgi:hypothetical protein
VGVWCHRIGRNSDKLADEYDGRAGGRHECGEVDVGMVRDPDVASRDVDGRRGR